MGRIEADLAEGHGHEKVVRARPGEGQPDGPESRFVEFRIVDPAPAPPKPGEDLIKSQRPDLVPEGMTAPDPDESAPRRKGKIKGKAKPKKKAGKRRR